MDRRRRRRRRRRPGAAREEEEEVDDDETQTKEVGHVLLFFYKNRFSSSIALALSRKVRDAFFFSALSVAIALVAVAVLSRGSNGGDSHRKEREREFGSVKKKSL